MFSIANLKRKLITKLFRLRRSGLQRYFNSKPIPQQGKSPEDILLDRVYTLPNAITLSRILASPLLGLAIVYDMQTVALGGCALAAFSDWLDGYIAKNYNQKSHFGSLLDPLADKVIIGTLAIALCYKGLLPLPLCGIILGRDLVLITGSFIIRYRTLPRGVKFFDYSHSSMFSIAPSLLSKVSCPHCKSYEFSSCFVAGKHWSAVYATLLVIRMFCSRPHSGCLFRAPLVCNRNFDNYFRRWVFE